MTQEATRADGAASEQNCSLCADSDDLAGQGQEDRSPHPRYRQVEARGRDLQSGRLQVRQGAQPGKTLTMTGRLVNDRETLLYMATMRHCRSCLLKAQCCPKAPFRRVPRSIYEKARDVARALAKTEAFERSQQDAHNATHCGVACDERASARPRGPPFALAVRPRRW
jgi:hypothetical protein